MKIWTLKKRMKNKNLKVTKEQFNKIVESLQEENQNLEEQSRLAAIGNSALNQMNIKPETKSVSSKPKPGVYKNSTVQITNDMKLKVTLPDGAYEFSCYKYNPTVKKV